MALEAINWVFRNLNDVGYLPFKMGNGLFLSYPTCRSLEQTVDNTYDILRRVGDSNERNRKTIIGMYEVILSLITRLEWNRIAIVYENDTYGIQAGTALKKVAEEKGICILVFHSVTVESQQAIDPNQINNILNSILLTTFPSVSGIVFNGSNEVANNLLTVASKRFSIIQASFVFSDGIQVQESKSRGAFAVGSPQVIMTEFEQYCLTLFRNTTLLLEKSIFNPWLLDVFQQKTLFRPGVSSCIGFNDIQLKTASSHCTSNMQYYMIMSSQGHSEKNLRFVDNGGISGDLESSLYEVFNFRKFPAKTGEFMFIKVGDYRKDGMHLNITEVRDYNSISKSNPDRFVCIPGDLYVIGIVPVYDKANPFGCGAIRKINEYQIAETMSYAVKMIQITIICNNPFVITEKIIDMYKNGLNLTMGNNLDPYNTSMNKTEVLCMDNRILVSELLQQLKFVQISYASTSPALSDRTLHPYFLRVTTPEDKQADAMMKIIKELKSEYIQVVYSEGSYGEGGRNSIRVAAIVNEICIAQELVIIESAVGLGYNILETLRMKSFAKIVIIFLQSHIVLPVMEALSKDVINGEFMFIESESWGKDTDFHMGIWNVFAYNSVLKWAYKTFSSLCGPTLRICIEYAENPQKVIQDIKTVQLRLNGIESMDVFDVNGDGRIGYTINYIQKNPKNVHELQYFTYNPGIKFEFNHDNRIYPVIPSMCLNPIACSNCSHFPVTTTVPIMSLNNGALIGIGVSASILFIALVTVIFPYDDGGICMERSSPTGYRVTATHRDRRGSNDDTNTPYLSIRDNTSETTQLGVNMMTLQHGSTVYNTKNNRVIENHAPASRSRPLYDDGEHIRVPQLLLTTMPMPQLEVVKCTYHTVQNHIRDNTMELGHTREITETDNGIEDGQHQMITYPYIHPIP
ncbi:hypothetical protein ACJMK2_022583 [Sinanodonta woodiana]|uniref:Receptor ligand binding region domain-containing protein n=1 Tax=Sinanodonta woodiana TaxID=1069815 RepID=A0ABD3TJH9_SINWO